MMSIAFKASNIVEGQEEATIIGEVREESARMVVMHTGFDGARMIDMLVGDPLPRGFVREIEAAGFVIGMRSAWCAIRPPA